MENLKQMICVFFLFIYNGLLANGSDSLDCNFENGLCNWIQDRNDNFNWTRRSGPTPTNDTGPDSDHTSGEGYYVYIDTSEVEKNKVARLISPLKTPGQYCLSFWCYMYGNQVRILKVFVKEGTSSNDEVFRISKDHGRRWILTQINVNTTESFKIVIEGKVRNRNSHDLGDIAIDDILMFSTEECPADCGAPIKEFGLVYSSGNITIGSTVRTSCEVGYKISGNPSMVCQANGSWSERPVCNPLDLEANALIAVYIVVPLIVVILIILLTVCITRKRQAKGHNAKHVKDTHPIIQYPNETYSEYAVQNHTRPPKSDESMSPDEDYAVIDHDGVGETSENVYYNTFDADCSQKDSKHQYDHTKNTSTAFTDKKYSHITGNVTDTKFKTNYDTIQCSDKYNEPILSDAQGESESYDHIHIKNHKEVMKQELSIKLDEEQESNYDHAIAGGVDPEVLEQDEYSHLNDANIIKCENNGEEMSTPYECQYYNISESTEEPRRTDNGRKAGYEEPVGQTPHYFVLEKNENESEEDKHKFVLKAEENGDENDGSSNHDYFVLEKTESV